MKQLADEQNSSGHFFVNNKQKRMIRHEFDPHRILIHTASHHIALRHRRRLRPLFVDANHRFMNHIRNKQVSPRRILHHLRETRPVGEQRPEAQILEDLHRVEFEAEFELGNFELLDGQRAAREMAMEESRFGRGPLEERRQSVAVVGEKDEHGESAAVAVVAAVVREGGDLEGVENRDGLVLKGIHERNFEGGSVEKVEIVGVGGIVGELINPSRFEVDGVG